MRLNKNILSSIIISIFFLFFIGTKVFGQIPSNGLDVRHYAFSIILNDSNKLIKGNAKITTTFTKNVKEIIFDLANKKENEKGMTVLSVTKNCRCWKFK